MWVQCLRSWSTCYFYGVGDNDNAWNVRRLHGSPGKCFGEDMPGAISADIHTTQIFRKRLS